jgi:hypothetical protein
MEINQCSHVFWRTYETNAIQMHFLMRSFRYLSQLSDSICCIFCNRLYSKDIHCGARSSKIKKPVSLYHEILKKFNGMYNVHIPTFLHFFLASTSWRLSEAISVTMVWMLSNYYSCSGRSLGWFWSSKTQNLFILSWNLPAH